MAPLHFVNVMLQGTNGKGENYILQSGKDANKLGVTLFQKKDVKFLLIE